MSFAEIQDGGGDDVNWPKPEVVIFAIWPTPFNCLRSVRAVYNIWRSRDFMPGCARARIQCGCWRRTLAQYTMSPLRSHKQSIGVRWAASSGHLQLRACWGQLAVNCGRHGVHICYCAFCNCGRSSSFVCLSVCLYVCHRNAIVNPIDFLLHSTAHGVAAGKGLTWE